ncbi:MAG: BrnT family toxin [Alphaproteobacteria bacterium]|nr:BrnT family toxin [Alphaproteobacteria bacterium]
MHDGFEWDEQKDAANQRKHLIGFSEAATIFDRAVLTAEDTRGDYGETRYISVGVADVGEYIVVVVAHTPRGENIRIISARRANRKERGRYDAYVRRGAA